MYACTHTHTGSWAAEFCPRIWTQQGHFCKFPDFLLETQTLDFQTCIWAHVRCSGSASFHNQPAGGPHEDAAPRLDVQITLGWDPRGSLWGPRSVAWAMCTTKGSIPTWKTSWISFLSSASKSTGGPGSGNPFT